MNDANRDSVRVILTGSSGTLGHNILRQLLKLPTVSILALHRKLSPDNLLAPGIQHEIIDFSKKRHLASLVRKFNPTCVIHCAADGMIFPKTEWFELIHFNVDFTLRLFEVTSCIPNCHFIHVSTGLAYKNKGSPLVETDALDNTHPYGASKAAADILLRSAAIEFGVPLTLFRPFSFTGLHDNSTRIFPSLLRAAVEKQVMPLSPGDQVRDFCSARDIAQGILLALPRPPAVQCPSIYNLGSGHSITLRNLINQIVDELEIPVSLKFGARPYGSFEPMHLVANSTHAQMELHWTPSHNLAHAVWELAQASFPTLKLKPPEEFYKI
jgi:UDP-glucose 4-epimerase